MRFFTSAGSHFGKPPVSLVLVVLLHPQIPNGDSAAITTRVSVWLLGAIPLLCACFFSSTKILSLTIRSYWSQTTFARMITMSLLRNAAYPEACKNAVSWFLVLTLTRYSVCFLMGLNESHVTQFTLCHMG